MDFSNQYLTYQEYLGLGGTINQMPFNLLEYECRRKIDNRTQNRLKDAEEIPQEVKLCEYKMINASSSADEKIEKISNNNLKSESIDGYSVSFATQEEVKSILEEKDKQIESLMEDYLMNVIVNNEHIMYLGVE